MLRLVKNIVGKTARRLLSRSTREALLQAESAFARRWVASAHRRLLAVQWYEGAPPEHFDHHIDLYYHWLNKRNSFWLERGVFGSLALAGKDVLELACGDGFNARNFYSLRSQHVIACDFDPKAIQTACTKNSAPNVEFVLADIRTAMPEGIFDNVIWDAAIEHFTPEEIDQVLRNIKQRLTPSGILSGYTIVEEVSGQKMLEHHEYEFKDMQDLLRFFTPYYKNVKVFETIYPNRHNLYFYASDGVLPFDIDWPHTITHKST